MTLRVLLHKVSDEKHTLEIVRADGRRERVDCETRSYLQHDLLHYAAEAEASLGGGFWGSLAGGRTLAEMNDRTGTMPVQGTSDMMMIERVVGVLSGLTKGRTPDELVTGLTSYSQSLGETAPAWLTTEFVTAVQERMRTLLGRWKATPFGGTMELAWPPTPQSLEMARLKAEGDCRARSPEASRIPRPGRNRRRRSR